MPVTAPSVAIITSTIGRPHLERAILSVQQQSYTNCKHYVFVDGEQFFTNAKTIVEKYPHVVVTYLPMNTGANGWTNSSINAIAPFLVKEDLVCYLDDDNWYEPNHVENCVRQLTAHQYDYVYSMRNFMNVETGKFICQDTFESVGKYHKMVGDIDVSSDALGISGTICLERKNHIDTNCYCLKREVAIKASQYWYSGECNDNNVSNWLLSSNEYRGDCTHTFCVNYALDVKRFAEGIYESVSARVSDEVTEAQKIEILEDFVYHISNFYKNQ
ncbi:glycosyltransferase family 2 protein [Actinobacillus equuli]|uniref:glycosyltransferase family 2 protein n=1 Tax=Actinobacillus equuli TaxID=718 RepID=UPI0024419B17|nr:glycosyltransferase family A protein [Actinobacillus equuli]WGE45728.1 glycosyltransferase family 2 protein [Actinobacillus equuli subsp. haemolyticus]